jgi:protein-tyrosine phosphatase
MAKKQVLFLCTGNYYRSRYAEELFNHSATLLNLCWRASSRALAIECGKDNVGPIAIATVGALGEDGIVPINGTRFPLACSNDDLAAATIVVAVKESEHRNLLATRFSGWENRVVYWNIHDIDQAHPVEALAELKAHVKSLIDLLLDRQTQDNR